MITMKRSVSVLAAATLMLAAGCGRERNHGITWAPAQEIGAGAAPVFALSPSGRLALAWVSAPAGGTDGRLFVQSVASGGVAEQPARGGAVELRDPLGSLSIYGEVPPKIAFGPDGSLYAAYLVTRVVPGMRWPQNALRFAVSQDGGATWDEPQTVTGDTVFGSYDDHALHVATDGTIYLSWLAEVKPDTSHTFFARSSDGGKTWSKPATIDSDLSCPCCRTAMTTGPEGELYVAWRKRFPDGTAEDRDIVVARSEDHGATWSRPVRVHTDAWKVDYCPDAGPSIKVTRDGTLRVAWWTGKDGAAGTQYTESRDGGRTFSAPVPLGLAQHSRAAHIQLAQNDAAPGLIATAWDDGTLETPRIMLRLSRDGGRTFEAAQPVSAPAMAAGYPVIVLRADTVLVAWQERTLNAAAADSAAHASMNRNDPAAYVNSVGALHIVMRRGVIAEAQSH